MIIPDRYGYCIKCHKCLMQKKAIENEVRIVFTPDRDEMEVMLDDGSRMRVCICKGCKDRGLSTNDLQEIMKCVIEGWRDELKQLNWDQKRKDAYINRYFKKKILFSTDNLDDNVVTKKYEEIRSKEKADGHSKQK